MAGSLASKPTLKQPASRSNVVATAPSSPVLNQQWYDTTNDLWKRWNGTVWVVSGDPAFAANAGSTITLLTDSQRASITPLVNQVIYTTDTHLFYAGDGSTVGGVASPSGLSTDQLKRLGFIAPRHRKWLAALRYAASSGGNVPTSQAVGNSIVQGSGASSSANAWIGVLGSKLQTYSGVTSASWTPANKGVGGSTIACPVSYLADSAVASNFLPAVGRLWNLTPSVVYLMSLRNDTGLSIADFTLLTRVALSQVKQHNVDGVVVTEPPLINATTGAILDTQGNFGAWYDAQKQIASQESASYVDVWGYFKWLSSQGIDLRPLMSGDGVHPSDAGHALIASLVFQCMTAPTDCGPITWDRPATDGRVAAVIASVANTGGTLQNIGTAPLSALTTSTTARALDQAEGASAKAVVLASGQSANFFTPPLGAKGVILGLLDDASNTGTVTVTYNFSQTVASGVAMNGSNTREKCVYYSFAGLNGTLADLSPAKIGLAASGGQATVLYVVWIMPNVIETHGAWPAVEVGTWSAATLTSTTFSLSGLAGRSSATVGDTATIYFYGSSLVGWFSNGNQFGKFTVSIDGGGATTYDQYNSGYAEQAVGVSLAKNLTEGWHTAVITIATKNASSSANTVKFGGISAGVHSPDPSFAYITLGQGETMNLTGWWKTAVIDSVLSGSPMLRFTAGSSTIALSGTGSAIVRLAR